MKERKTFVPGMMGRNTGILKALRHMTEDRNDRGGMNHKIADQLRGRKKAFLGYGYLPQTKEAGGQKFRLFPDTVYMVRDDGAYVKVMRIGDTHLIVGRKAIKKYLEEQRKARKSA